MRVVVVGAGVAGCVMTRTLSRRRGLIAIESDGASPLLFKCPHCVSKTAALLPSAVLYSFAELFLGLIIVLVWSRYAG